jgi:hypothetical protein
VFYSIAILWLSYRHPIVVPLHVLACLGVHVLVPRIPFAVRRVLYYRYSIVVPKARGLHALACLDVHVLVPRIPFVVS